MRLGIVARRSGSALLLVALACLGLAACADGSASNADNGTLPFPTLSTSKPLPTATRPVVGPVAVTATPGASATATGSASPPTPTLTCAVHSAEGSDDDETQHTLTCAVKHAPPSDTRFTLHYGVRDPAGSVHPLDPACGGALHNGSGSCSQKYEFIVPFAPVPAPVTGASLPSDTALGPATPSSS